MEQQFEYYLDAWFAGLDMQDKLRKEGIKNLMLVTVQSKRKMELLEGFKPNSLINDKRNKLIATFRYNKVN